MINSLYGLQSAGGLAAVPGPVAIQLWSINLRDNPAYVNRADGPRAMVRQHLLLDQKSDVYQMTRQAVNVPDLDSNTGQLQMSYHELSDSQPASRIPMGELAILDSILDTLDWSTAADALISMAAKHDYLKDIEDCWHLLWPTDQASSDSPQASSDSPQAGAAAAAAGSAASESDGAQLQLRQLRQHYLNAALMNTEDRRSLLRLVKPGQRCAGFDTPSYYLKLPDSFFRMHWEQLFGPFYNYCWEGCTIWYSVLEEDRDALLRYLVNVVGPRRFGIDAGKLRQYGEEQLLWALAYSRQLFLDPLDLLANNVPVHRIEQTAGHAVVGKGTVLHWGQCGSGRHSVNEAVNWLPVQWLRDGLPQLVGYVDWLASYVARSGKKQPPHTPGLAQLFHHSVQTMVGHHTPRGYTVALCSAILRDLQAERDQRKCDYSALALTGSDAEQSFTQYREHLQHVMKVLNSKVIVQWYNKTGMVYRQRQTE